MDLDPVSTVLECESPENLTVQTYDAHSMELVLAFTSDGGPKEDLTYVVRFEQAVLFHLPASLYHEVRFRKATEAERERLMPADCCDPYEFSGAKGAYTVVLLTNRDGKALGYYIAAESVSGEWVSGGSWVTP